MECRAKLLLVLMALQSITTLRRHTATADDTLSPLFGHGLGSINLPCQNESMAQASSPSPTPHPDELISLLDRSIGADCANLGITLPHPHLPNIFKSSGG
ncbi:hypothetical protein BHE74_00042631, partial [Ensete ventricosum]